MSVASLYMEPRHMPRFFPSFRRAVLGSLALSLVIVFPLESVAQARPAAGRAQEIGRAHV